MNWQLTSGSGTRSVWSLGMWSFDSDHLHWNDLYFSFEILILWTLCILLGNKIWNGVIGGQGWDKVTFRQRTTMHTKQWKKLVQGQPWFSLNLKIHIQLNATQIEPWFFMKLYRRARFLETIYKQKSFNEHWHQWRPLKIEFEYTHTVWVIPNAQCRA